MLTHVCAFSGLGGMALAAREAGFETVLLCEIEPFLQAVLRHHFPQVPIVEDIRDVHAEGSKTLPTLLTGGFPFQANYARGERRDNDPNSLWSEFARVAGELRPAWVLAETIPRFVHLGIDEAAFDLENLGYSVTAFVLPSHALDCPARRDRLYLLGAQRSNTRLPEGNGGGEKKIDPWPAPEPSLHRVASGISDRLDECLALSVALGDATIPRSAQVILEHIAEIERGIENG